VRVHSLSNEPRSSAATPWKSSIIFRGRTPDHATAGFLFESREGLRFWNKGLLRRAPSNPRHQYRGLQRVARPFWRGELRERLDLRRRSGPDSGASWPTICSRKQKFAGMKTHPHDPRKQLSQPRTGPAEGNHISLSVPVIFCWRAGCGLPVAGIGLPGYFVCRYQSSRA